jgi:high-affinity nickel-transport protein
MHGLAGSAALTLLVLTQTRSMTLGLAYLTAFGIGSIGGMALMSLVISLPFNATAGRPRLNRSIRIVAGGLGLAFGLFYAWSQVHPVIAYVLI